MAKSDLPPVELLRKILDYHPETGKLTWKARTTEMFVNCRFPMRAMKIWNSKYAGKAALNCFGASGYLVGDINGKSRRAHRVVWALTTGAWPTEEIDHINGVKSDNRLVNLRECSHIENARNCGVSTNNRSGHLGVFWANRRQRWVATIKINRRSIYLGQFVSIEDAVAVRKEAETRFGFHGNHGLRPSYHSGTA